MFKKLLLSSLFFNYLSGAHALQITTIDNATRYTFEPNDYLVNIVDVDNYSWNLSFHASLYSNSKGCSISTIPIFIASDFKLSGFIEMKAYTSVFIESITELNSIDLLNIKLNYDNYQDNYNLDEGRISISQLKEVRKHANTGDAYYITAKTPGYNYIRVPINFDPHNKHPSGKISLCISDILRKSRISIKNIIVDISN